MELPIAELKNAQSRLDIAMNRIEEIIAEVHKLRLDKQNLSDVQTKLQFLQDDLIKRQKLVSAIVKQIKKMKKFRGQGNKQMSKAYEKLQAYETEVSVLSKIQNDIATISNKDFAELRRMMNPTAALRDLFTGIAILFKVPKWKRWPNVQSFIAKSSTKQKILALRPHHLDAKTVKRVRKFLNEHEETVNRLAAYKANRKIAPLEPWLRTMVTLAEKIVIYGLAPETLELELQKMQQQIKSENELTQTLSRCKAREKDIINAFQTIFRAKGENFEGFRTLSDFLGEKVEEDNSDLDIGDKNEESKDGAHLVSEFVDKDKGRRQPFGLGVSVGVNSSDVLGKSSASLRPKPAAKGSRRQGRLLEETNNPALKKKKVRTTRVLSYFTGPSNSIPGKGRREQGLKDESSRKGMGKIDRRRQEKDDQLPDLSDLLEENTKAHGKSSKNRKILANKDTEESRTFRSGKRAQPNESSGQKREIDLLESKGNNYPAELTLDYNPGPANLSISASRGSTFEPTVNNFTDIKYEEDDDLSLSLDDSLSVKELLTLCVTSNNHVSTGDFGLYNDFEGEVKDNQNHGVKKNPRSDQWNKEQVGDHDSSIRKGAKDNRTRKGARENKALSGANDTRTHKGAEDNMTRKGAKEKAIISHGGSQNRSSDGHSSNMGKVIEEQKIDHAYQKPSNLSLAMSRGTNDEASGNLNSSSRAPGDNNCSSDVGETEYAVTSISNQEILIDSADSLPESRSGSELGASGLYTRESLVENPVAGKPPVGSSYRDSVDAADMPFIDLKVEEEEEPLDPELLETLANKLRTSLRELDVDYVEHENEYKDTDQFKDIILRYNRHRRNSISIDTNVFDIWKDMGCGFKKYKKVRSSKKKKKAIGYYVEDETPYLKHVEDMRTKRDSRGVIEALDNIRRQRVNTI